MEIPVVQLQIVSSMLPFPEEVHEVEEIEEILWPEPIEQQFFQGDNMEVLPQIQESWF